MAWSALWFTWMSSEVELLQGALDLILLRALEAMGPQHAYSLAARLERVSKSRLTLKQGTLYPALVRLEQNGWIKGSWGRTENNREAKYLQHHQGRHARAREGNRAVATSGWICRRSSAQRAVAMATFRRFLLRLVHFFQPHRAESELERELAAHLGVLEDEYKRRGLTDAEARLAARRAFGGVAQAKELHRDARSFRWLNDLRQDTRFAARALLRAPGFTAVVVGTLALGIGANTAIFSVVHAVLLRSLPYPGADRFVRIAIQFDPDDGSGIKTSAAPVSFQDLEVLRSRSRTLSNLGTYDQEAVTLSGRGEAVHLNGVRISPQVMTMLEATPLMGRLLEPREEAAGLDRVAVISYSMWQRRLGADDDILGKRSCSTAFNTRLSASCVPAFSFRTPTRSSGRRPSGDPGSGRRSSGASPPAPLS